MFLVVSMLIFILKSFVWEVFAEGGWERLRLALVLVSCLLTNNFCCSFVDASFKELCMISVRGGGALGSKMPYGIIKAWEHLGASWSIL